MWLYIIDIEAQFLPKKHIAFALITEKKKKSQKFHSLKICIAIHFSSGCFQVDVLP
jgi:hypothetical protein